MSGPSFPLYTQYLPMNCSQTNKPTYDGTVKIAPYVVDTGNQNGTYEQPNSTSPGNSALQYWSYDEYAFDTASVWSECINGDAVKVYYGANPVERTVTGYDFCGADAEGDSGCWDMWPGYVCSSNWTNDDWIPEWANPAEQQQSKPDLAFWEGCSGPLAVSTGPPHILGG
jgi:hypothetical protein